MQLASGKKYTIRAATKADGPGVRALVFTVLAEYGLQPDPAGTDSDLADLERNYLQSGGWFVVVEEEPGRVIGSAGLFPLGEGACELRKMYLAREARGGGIGRELLRQSLQAARQLGFRRVTLETASVLKEAIALYTRHGFKPVPGGVHSARCDQAFELEL